VLAEPLRATGPALALLAPVLAAACAAVLELGALGAPVLAAACGAFLALALLVPVLAGICLVLALGLGFDFSSPSTRSCSSMSANMPWK
jgi:hypothetical protein